MNVSSQNSSAAPRFVDTTTDENLIAVYEKHVRFNFGLQAGERQMYLDAMKSRWIDVEKYLGDDKLPSEYQENFTTASRKASPRYRDRVAKLMAVR